MPLHDPAPSAFAADPAPGGRPFSRVVLATLAPTLARGPEGVAWPLRRSVGEAVEVVAGLVTDGHDRLRVELVVAAPDGTEAVHPMPLRYNDEYVARFTPEACGTYRFRVRAWLDTCGTWQEQYARRVGGGETEALLAAERQDLALTLRGWAERDSGGAPPQPMRGSGASLDLRFPEGAAKAAKAELMVLADRLDAGDEAATTADALARVDACDPRDGLVESAWQPVEVDPRLATFAAWYEFFPRSAADPGPDGRPVHGTLDDAARRLARIKEMGFDVVYLPPVSPIGVQHRKGKDGALGAGPDQPGSPWAIGGFLADGTKGGHADVADELGGLPAFERFVKEADRLGLAVALDIAFQASPDHPWVDAHPGWFRHRPDGSIRYAENPPKKYQDVYPFDFEAEDWPALWTALKGVFEAWIARGVRVFRVDNPHTKPFAFWAWCLAELRRDHPDLVFLAEAFSRPKIMEALAKIGFNNSYTYFTWRLTKEELTEYATELWHGEKAEYFRPNFWPNTPDIFHDTLGEGGRALHIARFVLAATLSPVYGVYGPPYEHPEQTRKHPEREEYADNEKFELRTWNWHDPTSLQPLMRRVNEIRHAEPALQQGRDLRFLEIDHPEVIAFVKQDGASRVLVVASLNPHGETGGRLVFDPSSVGLDGHASFVAYDALSGETYRWQGREHVVRLTPARPAHIFVLHQG